MQIGFIVGSGISVALIILGVVSSILSKKKQKKNNWSIWVILIGILALISAAFNYSSFGR